MIGTPVALMAHGVRRRPSARPRHTGNPVVGDGGSAMSG